MKGNPMLYPTLVGIVLTVLALTMVAEAMQD